ncbi:ectonucleotide pyrophosphatase/phosphodiesterase family member 7-like [Callorhinchus milii]|uniref:ectonucleotide pyrophosphatase/phosphodiesterase family member 7-like n=1 Tax=Callorhinchus milii TaxID=7868 RepID=UPI0004571E5B|nr:ectonucleotide pyrophosphatase/phosphodiesterase family member 7-like [Callorhinchus milii]|eukprot:gi/632942966/ref/XP_007886711.1/ PREDICTED: ectonucleotide pyrophosphatase/phosphodiesterase family member 7-like [Callorhinchus milii]
MHIHLFLLLGLFLTLTNNTPLQPGARKTHNKLLLISVDGFRWDYDQHIETPNLQALVKEGVKAKYITPSFITLTSPSHFTLLTGRDIESHGVIHNMWFNTTTGEKKPYYATQGVNEWWDTGSLPIWITAQRQGLKTGSIHFPGTKPTYDGEEIFLKIVEPQFYNYSNETAWRENIDTVMKWFTVDDLDFVTLYFGEPDSAGHKHGPDSEKVRNAVRQVDSAIGYLVQSIEKHGLKSNLNVIITADHGMTTVLKEPAVNEIVLGRFANFSFKDIDFEMLDYGPCGMLLPKEGKIEKVYQALKGAHPHLTVYKKEDLPERLRYSKHERILPILLFGNLGYVVHGRLKLQFNKGEHGFDNQYMDMKMIFRAFGPDFKKNYLAEPFDSVNIYPLMCNLLKIAPEPNNGSLEITRGMLSFESNRSDSALSQGLVGLAAVAVFLILVAFIAIGSSLYTQRKDRRTHNEDPSDDNNMSSTGF